MKQQAKDVAAQLRHFLGVKAERELLRTDQLAERFQFPSAEAARKFISRYQVPREYRGRVLLVDVRDFQATLDRIAQERQAGAVKGKKI